MNVVLQGSLNRAVSRHLGLASAVLLNSLVLVTSAVVLWSVARRWPERVPEIFRAGPSQSWESFGLWMLVPGFLGLTIVAGIPWAISRMGALKFFVGFIGAQIVVSLLWDLWVEGVAIGGLRVLGAALSVLGAVLVAI